MMQLINSRLRLTLSDGRTLVGQLLAYDKHLNLVLADVEEFRSTKGGEQRRSLGFLVLRGKPIVSMCPEGVPEANRTRVPVAQQNAATKVPAPGAPLTGPIPGMYTSMPYPIPSVPGAPTAVPGMPMPYNTINANAGPLSPMPPHQ